MAAIQERGGLSLKKGQMDKLAEITGRYKGMEGSLIATLHEIQEYLGYIPYEAQKFVAEELDVPMTEVYGVVTFYSRFTTEPTGKHKVSVCLGTACYVKGADKVLEKIQDNLKIKAGETTPDGMFTLEATRCIGACGLAPVMMIGEDVYGKLTTDQIEGILKKYKA